MATGPLQEGWKVRLRDLDLAERRLCLPVGLAAALDLLEPFVELRELAIDALHVAYAEALANRG